MEGGGVKCRFMERMHEGTSANAFSIVATCRNRPAEYIITILNEQRYVCSIGSISPLISGPFSFLSLDKQ